jgi:hypothetical protein
MILEPDATISDVQHTLKKPLNYVCGILDNLHKCKKQHGDAIVAIGVTGTGQSPYYRIMYSADGNLEVFDTFFNNHVSFSVEDRPITGGESWSIKYMTLEEVTTLRGKIKG